MPELNNLLINFLHGLGEAIQQINILQMIENALDYIPQNIPEIYNQSVQTLQHYLDKANMGYIKAEIVSPLIIFIMTRHIMYSIIKFIFVLILITNLSKILTTI